MVLCVSSNDIIFKSDVTTDVDVGTSGWINFPVFKRVVIDRSQLRILVFMNIAGSGMSGFPSEEDVSDMDPWMISLMIKRFKDIIVGVNIGHYRGSDWDSLDRAIEAGILAEVLLIKECHTSLYFFEGNFGFQDAYGKKFNGTKRLEFELTLLRGIIEWNLNGLGAAMWDEAPIIY